MHHLTQEMCSGLQAKLIKNVGTDEYKRHQYIFLYRYCLI